MIPLRSGNLGVTRMTRLFDGANAGAAEDDLADLELWREFGVGSVEEYVGWAAVELSPGEFAWQPYRDHALALKRAGLRYAVFPWVHAVPPWFARTAEFVPFRCTLHGAATYAPSIWVRATRDIYRRFYRALAGGLGDLIDRLYVAGPADYGEVGYPTGMAEWVTPYPEPFRHHHQGLWCGGDEARAHFTRMMRRRHARAHDAARAWQVPVDEQGFWPYPTAASTVRHRLDFAAWYTGSMTRFMAFVARLARSAFPHLPIEIRLGHGSELLAFGQDVDDLLELCRRERIAIRSTQASLGYFQHKRIATPCHALGLRYTTEPLVDQERPSLAARLYKDVACGTQELFEFADQLRLGADIYRRHGHLLRGEQSVVDVALFYPTTDHRAHPQQGFPPALHDVSEPWRDLFDYDIVGEPLVRARLLDRYRVVFLVGGGLIDVRAGQALLEFAAHGGAIAVIGAGAWLTPDGDAGIDRELCGALRGEADPGLLERLHGDAAKAMAVELGSGSDRSLLTGTWYGPETAHYFWGGALDGRRCRWTGPRAGVRFPVVAGASYDIDCELHVPPESGECQLWVNGHVASGTIRHGTQSLTARCTVPAGATCLDVQLVCRGFVPRDARGSDDTRMLGVVVQRVTARLVGDASAVAVQPRLHATLRRSVITTRCLRRIGRGAVLHCPTLDPPVASAFANEVVHGLSEIVPGLRSAPRIDGVADGVWATRFERHVLLFNTLAAAVEKQLRLGAVGGPELCDVVLPPYELLDVAW
ncbi:MAG: hypothetical protein U1E76_04125 [Planctomycetota bacterium]